MIPRLNIRRATVIALASALFIAGCSKDAKREGDKEAAEHPAGEKAASGKVIVVEAYSDAQGNYFKPNEITAKPGDIVRFTLKAGVHNVNFLADSNPGAAGLPHASDMLQLPDQTYDVNVTFAKGRYYFQCDPHALLGMKGHLTVAE